MLAIAVKVILKYCVNVFGCDSNPYSQAFFFNYMSMFWFLNLSVIPFLKF
jgi:hypothetical protein